jgi:hypothetical protein
MSATAPFSFTPSPLNSMPAGPLVAPIVSQDPGGGDLCPGSSTGHGANAGQADVIVCYSSDPPAWTFDPQSDTVRISGLCMAVSSAVSGDAASADPRVVLNPCDAGAEQIFVLQSGGYLYNPGSGLCVTEAAGKKHQQPVVVMELCGAAAQQWNTPTG